MFAAQVFAPKGAAMTTRLRFILLVLLVLPAVGVRCQPGTSSRPSRPTRFTPQELVSPAHAVFFETFGEGEQRGGYGSIFYTRMTSAGRQMYDNKAAMVAFHRIPEQPDMVLSICYNANPKTDPPPMQLQLLAKTDPPLMSYGFLWGGPGDPVVLCDLNPQQVDYVFNHGVPEPLVEAMVSAAEEADWSSELPAPHLFGEFILVDAAPYFRSDREQEDAETEK